MNRFLAYNRTASGFPYGVFVLADPTCQMRVAEGPCGKPATERVTYRRGIRVSWSLPWCPEHAAISRSVGNKR